MEKDYLYVAFAESLKAFLLSTIKIVESLPRSKENMDSLATKTADQLHAVATQLLTIESLLREFARKKNSE